VELDIELEDIIGDRSRKREKDVSLIQAAVGNGTEREDKPRIFFSQQLGSTGVEGSRSSGKTDASTGLVNREVFGELANHEEEEGEIEEEEEGNQCDVDFEGRQAE